MGGMSSEKRWESVFYVELYEKSLTKQEMCDKTDRKLLMLLQKKRDKKERGISMKLVFLIGNGAVGKMTVGQELMKLTGLRLFHNHMTIEPVIEVFGYYNGPVVSKMRKIIFEEFAKSDNYGMIFTYMWAFDQQSDWDSVEHVTNIFKEQGAEVYYVELVAPQEVRLKRNETENRLKNKASKRDLEASRERIIRQDEKYRLESYDGEITFENYMKIDNTNLEPAEVARMIQERFSL